MAESPAATLARLVAGIVLMQGRLGHQVLGQLLVADSRDLAIAGASVVIAAASREKNSVAQALLRTAAPAVAVRFIATRSFERVERLEAQVADRERAFREASWEADHKVTRLNDRSRRLATERDALLERVKALEARLRPRPARASRGARE